MLKCCYQARMELIMAEVKYYARIRITTYPVPIMVEVMANNYLEAQKKIEAQYVGSFKSWYTRPTTKL